MNLTLDTGDNPGAVGIKFYSNNTGEMRRVNIRGNGVCGLDLGSHDQNGPLLIEDVDIRGFTTGINFDYGINSQTLSKIRISGAEVGIRHRRQIVAIEDLQVVGAQTAVKCLQGGTIAILGARFSDGNGGAAIEMPAETPPNLYVRSLITEGYAKGISGGGAPAGDAVELSVREYSSHGIQRPNPDSNGGGLFLDIPPAPVVPWETDPAKWVCANDHGMTNGDKGAVEDDDDGIGLQRAIDHAAQTGATTVYIIGGTRREPNWFHIRTDVRVHGSVRRVIGIGFVRLLNGHGRSEADPRFPENMPKLIVDDEEGAPEAVAFEHLNVFSNRAGFCIEAKAQRRAVMIRASTPVVIARTGSRVFMNNVVAGLFLQPGSQIVARHLNTEGTGVQTHNDHGLLYIVGFKTEKAGTKLLTSNGGKTEVFGSLVYNNTGDNEGLPCFEVRDAAFFSGAHQEVHFGKNWYATPVKLVQDGQEYRIDRRPWMNWSGMRAGD